MGLFDVIKQQGMNVLQQGTNALNNLTGNQQNQQASSSMPPTPPNPAPVASNHGDGIYGNHLEHLIDMALADGELTEKEKQVLFKKAEAMGIDLDEFEMVLDARLFEKQKAMQVSQPIATGAAPTSNKYGDVKKCPGCGAIVESFTTRCPDCGLEFSNIETVASIQTLMQQLRDFDAKNGGIEIINLFTGGTMRRNEKKKQIIMNFPFPTTKNDILEFLSMAAPLAKYRAFFGGSEDAKILAPAWKAKCEQLIMKARLSMKDDPNTLAEIEKYAKELKIK